MLLKPQRKGLPSKAASLSINIYGKCVFHFLFLFSLAILTQHMLTPTERINRATLYSNRSSDEKKEKGGEKTPEHQNSGEHETAGKNPKLVHLEINRGTAV